MPPSLLRSAAYGAVMLASSALHNVFVTYYLALFSAHAALTPAWFFGGQAAFLVWNAVNDPLFGWLSDTLHPCVLCAGPRRRGLCGARSRALPGPLRSPPARLLRRTAAIRWGGLLWAAAFALVWWPPAHLGSTIAGLHFTASLLLYDSALTYVEVNHGALLAEMPGGVAARASANAWAAGGSALGCVSALAAYAAWRPGGGEGEEAGARFRSLTLALAVSAAVVFLAAAQVLEEEGAERQEGKEEAVGGEERLAATALGEEGEAEPAVGALGRMREGASSGDTGSGAASEQPGAWHRLAPSSESHVREHVEPLSESDPRARDRLEPSSARESLGRDHLDPSSELHTLTSHAGAPPAASPPPPSSGASPSTPSPSYLRLLLQLARSPRFRTFTLIATLQSFDCAFGKGFFVPAMDALRSGGGAGGPPAPSAGEPPASGSLSLRAGVIAASFLLPHCATLLWTPSLGTRGGLAAALARIFSGRLALLGVGWLASHAGGGGGGGDAARTGGPGARGLPLLAFMLGNRVLSESVCRLFPMALAELVEEDALVHKRVRGVGWEGG